MPIIEIVKKPAQQLEVYLKRGDTGAPGAPGTPGAPGAPGAPGEVGPQGEQGKSAFVVAQDNGFTGTEAEWLESIRGPVGPQGAPGVDGIDGINGIDGAPGPKGDTGPAGVAGPLEVSTVETAVADPSVAYAFEFGTGFDFVGNDSASSRIRLNPLFSEQSPQFTRTSGKLSRIDYVDGSYKLFSRNALGKVSQIDWVRGAVTYRKTFNYDASNVLQSIVESEL